MTSPFPHDGNPPGINILGKINQIEFTCPFTVYNPSQTNSVNVCWTVVSVDGVNRSNTAWFEYSYDEGATWSVYYTDTVLSCPVKSGISFRINTSNAGSADILGNLYSNIRYSVKLILYGYAYVYGNILSLIRAKYYKYNDNNIISYDATHNLGPVFSLCGSYLLNAPYLQHIRGSTYMFAGVNEGMFEGCTSIVVPSELNIRPYSSSLYRMYKGCTSLRRSIAARFNVTDYREMFCNCTGLVTAKNPFTNPEATTVNKTDMFSNCTNLREVKIESGTYNTGQNCSGMFRNNTSLESIHIPFSTVHNLYFTEMFYGCSSLSQVEVDFKFWRWTAGSNTIYPTTDWLSGVSPTGTFICPAELDTSIRDASHIPEGWTIVTK